MGLYKPVESHVHLDTPFVLKHTGFGMLYHRHHTLHWLNACYIAVYNSHNGVEHFDLLNKVDP